MFINILLLFSILSTNNYVYGANSNGVINIPSDVENFDLKYIEDVNGQCILAMIMNIKEHLMILKNRQDKHKSPDLSENELSNKQDGIIEYLFTFLLINGFIKTEKMFGDSIWSFINIIKAPSGVNCYEELEIIASTIINEGLNKLSEKGIFKNYYSHKDTFHNKTVIPIVIKCYDIQCKLSGLNGKNENFKEKMKILEQNSMEVLLKQSLLLGKYGGLVYLLNNEAEIKEYHSLITENKYSLLVTIINDVFSDILDAINCVLYSYRTSDTVTITRDAELDILLAIQNIYVKVIKLADILTKLMVKCDIFIDNQQSWSKLSDAFTEFINHFKVKWITFCQIHDENKSKELLKTFQNRKRHISGRLLQKIEPSTPDNDVYDFHVKFDIYYSIINWSGLNTEFIVDWLIPYEHECLINLNVWTVLLINYGKNMMTSTPNENGKCEDESKTIMTFEDRKFMENWNVNEKYIPVEIVA